MSERILIIGAGAIGGYIGAYLSRAGRHVTLIDPWSENVEAIRRDGVSLEGLTPEERFTVPLNILHLGEAQQLHFEPRFDIGIIALKSYDTLWATRFIRPFIRPDGVIASTQNCINDARVASVAGEENTLGIVITIAAELYQPGKIRRGNQRGAPGSLRVGEFKGGITPRLQRFGEIFQPVDTVLVTDDLYAHRWTKLSINAMRNSIAAASGLTGNDLIRNEAVRRFAIRLGGEAAQVGLAQGLALDAINRSKPEVLVKAAQGDVDALREAEANFLSYVELGTQSEHQRPSMGQDIRRNRRTEIDYMNALIVETGRQFGIPTPANAAIVDAIHHIERRQLTPSPELIIQLGESLAG
ncbi:MULTISPECIES: 2-dehydropantoate 2-reductase [unclassified Brenneria]|uniref:ketopantoate reductase family protein n=1 Tax=unclassified Brenneria TaxID=2634434 RepID=UPI0029C58330|nr:MULTISPECIES: 2-dehydropantoate 2-reductase [unclassified Brenneria]MDX5630917.1 2-dehydropantoate 2-reductase [Brenneria sp. L3-3Z]MDX5697999.1 2-dehydropantoate 2-reductase [Brenneria sp. L4-2C]